MTLEQVRNKTERIREFSALPFLLIAGVSVLGAFFRSQPQTVTGGPINTGDVAVGNQTRRTRGSCRALHPTAGPGRAGGAERVRLQPRHGGQDGDPGRGELDVTILLREAGRDLVGIDGRH